MHPHTPHIHIPYVSHIVGGQFLCIFRVIASSVLQQNSCTEHVRVLVRGLKINTLFVHNSLLHLTSVAPLGNYIPAVWARYVMFNVCAITRFGKTTKCGNPVVWQRRSRTERSDLSSSPSSFDGRSSRKLGVRSGCECKHCRTAAPQKEMMRKS